MDRVHVIRHKVLVEGLSQRQVADQLQVSRNTVKKYIRESSPKRKASVRRGRPKLAEVRPRIDQLLDEWKTRTTKKQRITGSRLHAELLKEGFDVGITTVRTYYAELRRQTAEVFVPLVHRIGDEGQVDFFEVTVEIDGERKKCWMFLMRLMYSGRDFAWLYDHGDTVSFLDGHIRAFCHFDGIPGRLIYDNLSAAVKRVIFPGRELTDRFKALVSHYLFEPCFARPATGHDKGGVESRGKAVRYQHLVPIPRGKNLEAISDQLMDGLDLQASTRRNRDGETVMQRFAQEQPKLRPLPEGVFEPRQAVLLDINRKSLVTYDSAVYSLPSHWAGLSVTAYVGPIDIRFVCRDEIRERVRVRRRKKNIVYTDYLAELHKKPQAVRQVAPELLASLGEPFADLYQLLEKSHGGKQAGRTLAKLLKAVHEQGKQPVAVAIRQALLHGEKQLLHLATVLREPLPEEIEVPAPLTEYVIESACAADYNVLLAEGNQ
jgi:transposase